MPTTPVSITALPTPPSTTSPSDFDSKADAFLGALPTLRTEVNSVASTTYNNAAEALSSANAAQISAAAAGAVKWTSATSFVQYAIAWSPSNYQVYRKISAGTSTTATDPGGSPGDTTNWVNVSPLTVLTAASTYVPLVGTLGITGVNLGSGQFRIKPDTYYLGIGTADPASMIHLNAASDTSTRVQFTASTNTGTTSTDGSYVGLSSSLGNLSLWNFESKPIIFGTSNQERMQIDSSGNTGIGRAPTIKLDVNGGIAIGTVVQVSTASYTILASDYCLRIGINCTLTFPAASVYPGRIIRLFNAGGFSASSAAANITNAALGSVTTTIFGGTAGKFADIQSDGTNWYITASN